MKRVKGQQKLSDNRRSSAVKVRKPRAAGLTRDRIVADTIRYLREHPEEQFSLARAGVAVDATAMAMYGYFEDAADLTDAIVAKVLEGVGAEIPRDTDWRIQVRLWMNDVYDRLMATPQTVDMLSTANGLSTSWLSASAVLSRCLATAGWEGRQRSEALFWIAMTVIGFARQTLATPLAKQLQRTRNGFASLSASDRIDLAQLERDIPEIYARSFDIMVERTLASLEFMVPGGSAGKRR